MIQKTDINNNAIIDYSKRQIITELKHKDAIQEYLQQFFHDKQTGSSENGFQNIQLSFLESGQFSTKNTSNVYELEGFIRQFFSARKTREVQDLQNHKNASNESYLNVYKSLPFYASWFDFEKIHLIEIQNLPEFFGEKASKSQRIYLRMRNFLIHLYWKNPRIALTATTSRRCITGDVCTIIRVHGFLENWGLINAQLKGKLSLQNDANNFEFSDFEIPKNESTKKTEFCEINFDQNLFEFVFGKLNMIRPRCFQCQKKAQFFWFTKFTRYELIAENQQPDFSSLLILCQNCHKHENFPVFYSLDDFHLVKLSDLFKKNCALQNFEQKELFSLNVQTKVLKLLSEKSLESLKIGDVTSLNPNIGAELYIYYVLEILSIYSKTASDFCRENIEPSLREPKLFEKMERLLSSISCALETDCQNKNEDHKIIKEQQCQKFASNLKTSVKDIFAQKLEKTSLRFAFFEEFEKILYQEKQNIKMFN